jgi:hypothetical protein
MNRSVRIVGVGAGQEPSRRSNRHSASGWSPLLCAALLAGCGALSSDNAVVGGETHFLISCEGGCGPALSCIAGVCTRGCEPGYSSCSELAAEAQCVSAADGSEPSGFSGTCDVSCAGDADCTPLGVGHLCRAGSCRADAASSQMALASPASSSPVHAVDAATCQSGLRWAGDDSASAEMHPGSDCVGCHRDTGAAPPFSAGTVYASGGESVVQPEDCFGLEGVAVTITDAEGREHSTVTNRAGNFYFEGAESDFPLPYAATFHWYREGQEIWTPMATTPSYGGCARCHANGLVPVGGFDLNAPAEAVIPVGPLFTPGLHPERR